ncbi:hypothetical protein BLA60_12810 [Actinophytocola xinjiangensis]|uniref:Membrane protein DUF2207 n=1 Tax=Actinophytocola xinjiangensis TaxID=485602 RepID=A0A7Z1AZL7_9PSEU|nr:hypothetical protein BLA60_12810 [Actinophytocola xinjiangensis]
MLAKWGAAALVAGVLAVAQPTAQPSPPPGPTPGQPSLDFPVPPSGEPSTEPSGEPGTGPGAPPSQIVPRSVNLALRVEPDGRLSVTEQVFVHGVAGMTRHAALRIRAGDRDRVFTIDDLAIDGNGSAETTDDELILRLREGVTTVKYTVDGAVGDVGGHQQVRWQLASGWDVDLRQVRASFAAPSPPENVVCRAGRQGSDTPCESAITDHGQVLRVVQPDLPAGERVDLQVTLPGGTVGANARFDEVARPSAFAITPVSGIGLGVLALVLVGGFGLLWLARGRDTRATATDIGSVEPLVEEGGRVAFASPDGVLPGEVGTVIDEHVDVADVTATVVDLAVRNYLAVRRTAAGWTLVRRNPADAALTGYETAVHTALFRDGPEVALAGLRVDLAPVREDLYASMVRHGWFTRRPDRERTRWTVAGALLALVGAVTTVVLALTVGHALLGLAVVAGGLGLTVGARLMPARTARGSVLVQQVRGLRGFLRGDLAAVPAADREMVLSRSLPYAVVLGESTRWLAHLAGLERVYWFEGDLAAFPEFLRELDAAFAASGQLR